MTGGGTGRGKSFSAIKPPTVVELFSNSFVFEVEEIMGGHIIKVNMQYAMCNIFMNVYAPALNTERLFFFFFF